MPLFMDRCDLYVLSSSGRGRLGSQNKASEVLYDQKVACTFVQDNERVINNENSDMTLIENITMMFPRTVTVSERMIVRNVRDRSGQVLEEGPFMIGRLIPMRTIGKLTNHLQAQLKKDYSLKES